MYRHYYASEPIVRIGSQWGIYKIWYSVARLAQLVERKALNLVVVGSSPTVGKSFCIQMSETYTHALRAAAKVSVQQDGRAQTE